MDNPPPPHELEGIPPGARWEQVIRENINAADFLMMMAAVASLASLTHPRIGSWPPSTRSCLDLAMEPTPPASPGCPTQLARVNKASTQVEFQNEGSGLSIVGPDATLPLNEWTHVAVGALRRRGEDDPGLR